VPEKGAAPFFRRGRGEKEKHAIVAGWPTKKAPQRRGLVIEQAQCLKSGLLKGHRQVNIFSALQSAYLCVDLQTHLSNSAVFAMTDPIPFLTGKSLYFAR
jgi:hypothetical protein